MKNATNHFSLAISATLAAVLAAAAVATPSVASAREAVTYLDYVTVPSGAYAFLTDVKPEGDWKIKVDFASSMTGTFGLFCCNDSNGSDAPGPYEYLSPLRMDNVIYQVHCYAPMQFTHQGVHGAPVGPKWPDPEKKWDIDFLREVLRPVREFEKRHHAKIYIGEFSAIAWADGAEKYLEDCISVFEEYGWDWTYHAFREWKGWSVEHEGPDDRSMVPSDDNPRKRALLEGFAPP